MAGKTDAKSLELTLKRETKYDEKDIDEEIELKIASNEDEIESEKEYRLPLFALDGDDIWIALMLFALVCITVLMIYLFREYNRRRYIVVLICAYIPSALMVVALNGNDIGLRKRSLIIIPSYCVALSIVVVIGVFDFGEFSGFITLTATIFSYIIICVIFGYQKAHEKGMKESGKYVLKIKGLILPVLMHFADLATDIGTTIEYYERSYSINDKDINNNIPYDRIFQTSIFIMIFYRVAGAFIVWEFSRSFKSAALQFIEVYIFNVLWNEWELGLNETGRVHDWLNLIESIFESGPQAIISTYILVADHNKKGSLIIWISTILSIISIASKTKTQDDLYFSASMKAKQADWKKKPQCSDGRCVFCNYRWFVRVCWRIIDITGFILLCTAIWLHTGGINLFYWLGFLLICFGGMCGTMYFSYGYLNMHYMNGLLACAVTGWNKSDESNMLLSFATVVRYIINFVFALGIYLNYKVYDELSLIILVMIICTGIGYFMMVMRDCSKWICDCKCGNNWVEFAVDSALNISSCNNKTEIYKLGEEGVDIKHCLKEKKTWERCPRPMDLMEIADELAVDFEENTCMGYFSIFTAIGSNISLDPNTDENEIRKHIHRLKEVDNTCINYKGMLDMYYVQYHTDIKWINVLVEEGAYVDYDKCIDQTKFWNETAGKQEIIEFFEGLKAEHRNRCEAKWDDKRYAYGQGTIKYQNGDVYVGHWEKDNPDYEWENGKGHGQGRMTYENGDIDEGMWESGKFVGKGKEEEENGDEVQLEKTCFQVFQD